MADKQQFQREYILRIPPKTLYQSISTPSGLSEWFCDDVNIKNNVYSFFWEGAEEAAELLSSKNNEYVRFRWEEEDDEECFFEMRIKIDPLTKDVALLVTDFADDDDLEESEMLWDKQIDNLRQVMGC